MKPTKFGKSLPTPLVCSAYLLLPVIFFFFVISFKAAWGPVFSGKLCDPDYVYLLGSLNAAGFTSSAYVDHPGTPVQMIGGAVLRCHSLDYSGLRDDVLTRPEYYLTHLNYVVAAMNAMALFAVGIAPYLLTNTILPGLFIQLTPFLSESILYSMPRFKPEPFLVFTGLLFSLLIILRLIRQMKGEEKDRDCLFFFSILCGFGWALKITFVPLLVIPFFVFKKRSMKSLYILMTGVVFILFLLPYYHRMVYAIKLWLGLAASTGKYGQSGFGLIDFNSILPHLNILFKYEFFFMFTSLGLTGFIGLHLLVPKLRKRAVKSDLFRVLSGLLLTNILGIVMVVRSFSSHYLVPALSLTGLAMGLIYAYFIRLCDEEKIKKRPVHFLFIILFLFAGVYAYRQLPDLRKISIERDRRMVTYQKLLDEYKDWNRIFFYGSTSKQHALYFGDGWIGLDHADRLQSIYGEDVYFYHTDTGTFHDWRKMVDPEEVFSDYEHTVIFGPERVKLGKRQTLPKNMEPLLSAYGLSLVDTTPDAFYDKIYKFKKSEDYILK